MGGQGACTGENRIKQTLSVKTLTKETALKAKGCMVG